MTGDWLAKRAAIAAKQYDEWPDSFKEAFRLSLIVDRIPPELDEGISLLSEVDRLTAQLTSAKEKIERLTHKVAALENSCGVADRRAESAESALFAERKETERLRELLRDAFDPMQHFVACQKRLMDKCMCHECIKERSKAALQERQGEE